MIKKLRAGLNADETGNKANSLIFLHHYGFNIPLTYFVTTSAYERYISGEESLIYNLEKELEDLPARTWAVRSSTTAEDSQEFSFAGQFQTVINVKGTDDILRAIRKVWDSASFLSDNDYVRKTGITGIRCGVIIQEMIPSRLAGVSFSRNPVTNQNEIVIEAVEGAGEELVQKGVTPMRWRIRKKNVLEGDEGYELFHVIRKVAADTAKLKLYYGKHTDIEWIYDGKQLYYLQLRQITARKEIAVYSSKMAREMLPGQVKPLVWSVNIPLVNGTWIGLLEEIAGPLETKPEDLAKPFYYQAYFNIAVLGGILQKIGVPADSLEKFMTGHESGMHSFRPGIRALRHTFRIIRFVRSKISFEKRFLSEFEPLKASCREMAVTIPAQFSPGTYPGLYSRLFETGRKLAYLNIVTPMLMTMYHKGLKKKLAKEGLDYDTLDFRKDFPLMKDYEPLPLLHGIKNAIEALPPEAREKCISMAAMRSLPEAEDICRMVDEFTGLFGHLSESGTDLSYIKWEEDPEALFRMIMSADGQERRTELYTLDGLKERGIRVPSSMRKAYQRAGRFKVYREQISSLYIYGYGLFRKLFLLAASEMVSRGILEKSDDIFLLTREEVDVAMKDLDTPAMIDYRDRVRQRRGEMEETKDIVLPVVIYGEDAPPPETGKSRNHSGTGTSPGSYTGKTRVVKSLSDFDTVERGDIILIPFSDVSWTTVLAKAGAIVSETGGMLSHCSIIAREMGIPAMVSVANACAIGSGLTATVNGSNGILTLHDYE
ncbi:MAG: PEP-utilizing enzyme [Bacteroidales bacterium]|nr:PEP-utilizing enzyme [Bacteroidales bacterium]